MVYRLLDHTADIGIEVSASTLPELFSEGLRALTEICTDLAAIEPRILRDIELEAADLETLLVDWLGELIVLGEVDGLVFCDSDLAITEKAQGWWLEGQIRGETFDVARHGLKTSIKAVTFHQLEVSPTPEGWKVKVFLDL